MKGWWHLPAALIVLYALMAVGFLMFGEQPVYRCHDEAGVRVCFKEEPANARPFRP